MYEFIGKVLEINGRRDTAYKKVEVGEKGKSVVTLKEIGEADFTEYEMITEELRSYLSELSYDDIKLLETIMLLGREGKIDEALTGEELISAELDYMDKVVGFNGKENDIQYILDKAQLNDYLINGIKLLETIK